jgi:hypothetical protein
MAPSSRATGIDQLAAARFKTKSAKYAAICAAAEHQGIHKDPEAFSPFIVFASGAVCANSRPFLQTLQDSSLQHRIFDVYFYTSSAPAGGTIKTPGGT